MAKAIIYDIAVTLGQKIALEAAIRRLTNPVVPMTLHEAEDCQRVLTKLHNAKQRGTM